MIKRAVNGVLGIIAIMRAVAIIIHQASAREVATIIYMYILNFVTHSLSIFMAISAQNCRVSYCPLIAID